MKIFLQIKAALRHLGNPLISFLALIDHRSRIDRKAKINRFARVIDSTIGKYSYVGPGSKLINSDIGNFCSISWNCCIGLSSHPLYTVSTSPIFFEKHNGTGTRWIAKDVQHMPIRRTSIGSDVWIGANSIILEGLRIGHGAVIGAGAVVTTDVPPYTVVGGVPSRFIKKRFPDDIIDALLEASWWNASDDEIQEKIQVFQRNPLTISDTRSIPRGNF